MPYLFPSGGAGKFSCERFPGWLPPTPCVAVLLIFLTLGIAPTSQLRGASSGQAAADPVRPQQTAPAPPKRIAVLDFNYTAVVRSSQEVFSSNIDVGKGVADLLLRDLTRDGSYSVMEQEAVDKALAGQHFSEGERADRETAVKIGKILGVDGMVIGSVTRFGITSKKSGGEGPGPITRNADVEVEARLVNVATGEIVAAAAGRGESSRVNTSPLAGWHGFEGGTVDFASNTFQQTMIGEAVNKAVAQMSDKLAADRSRLVGD